MQVFYHITPDDRVARILREGLKPSITAVMTVAGEDSAHKIFLAEHKYLAMDQPMISETYYPSWTMLRVELPDSWPVYFDEDSLTYYARKRIPPQYIAIDERGITSLEPLPRN